MTVVRLVVWKDALMVAHSAVHSVVCLVAWTAVPWVAWKEELMAVCSAAGWVDYSDAWMAVSWVDQKDASTVLYWAARSAECWVDEMVVM